MSFTVLFAGLAVLVLIVVFAITSVVKGLKTALMATGVTFIVIAVLFAGLIYAIVSAMPN